MSEVPLSTSSCVGNEREARGEVAGSLCSVWRREAEADEEIPPAGGGSMWVEIETCAPQVDTPSMPST